MISNKMSNDSERSVLLGQRPSNFSVVLSRFYDFHIDTFIYNGSAAIIGYCGLLTISKCVPFLLSSNDNACDVAHDIASMMNNLIYFSEYEVSS